MVERGQEPSVIVAVGCCCCCAMALGCWLSLPTAFPAQGNPRTPPPPREVLQWQEVGGNPPLDSPPDLSDHRGENEIYNRENLVGPFLVH